MTADDKRRSPTPMPDYDKIDARLRELPDTPRAMLTLLDEFPEATPQDWWLAFSTIGQDLSPSWWGDEGHPSYGHKTMSDDRCDETVGALITAPWEALPGCCDHLQVLARLGDGRSRRRTAALTAGWAVTSPSSPTLAPLSGGKKPQ